MVRLAWQHLYHKGGFIDQNVYLRVWEAIQLRLCPNNINRDSGTEIPEAWIPTVKKKTTGEWLLLLVRSKFDLTVWTPGWGNLIVFFLQEGMEPNHIITCACPLTLRNCLS